MGHSSVQAMEHVVLVLFENRSFDNLLGQLYTPEEKPAFEGVLGRTSRTRSVVGPARATR